MDAWVFFLLMSDWLSASRWREIYICLFEEAPVQLDWSFQDAFELRDTLWRMDDLIRKEIIRDE